ncbi:pyridoxal phosphate-dependent aminotransferase [Puia dinghuensis]|uniref:Aminotransferase n=1 Tax=Puia dinghuensis TaxID=1792502 RepID=A0A8J2UAY1_9BACT|nr:aminotransferase class I/II-fold pyridoxal phosphate-dependent enzyme [Puia dinghuensis]GGA91533.1 aminotransferase [Puia dinghuensis]
MKTSSLITTAKRLEGIGEYYFSQKLREIDELNKQGKNVINLGIGSPDLPPDPEVIEVLKEESAKPNVHGYQSYKGAPALRKALADWYRQWYGVELDPDAEILPLIGSKEGIMHICMTYLDEGDGALVPNPGYPTYRSAVKLAGGASIDYSLTAGSDWFPDFDELERLVAAGVPMRTCEVEPPGRIKLMWVNYPQMPTGKLPTRELFERLVDFGRRHKILICHDNPYSFILNDTPMSLLATPGAKEVAVELNSLSKSQNMAGWRVGALLGAKERIDEVLRFKSNMDSGMFLPVQLAAAKALSLSREWYEGVNAVYKERRELAYELLVKLKCEFSKEQAGLFVWARIPSSYADGFALSDRVLHEAGVFITPGGIFGSAGENYVRVSLCTPVEKFRESINRIKSAGI